ncbi:MAG: bifunctional DNA-formamidopyrimidine glycosylase/DNA-(apurinic or apyrimidinic site) lyase [Chloroflexi bacterium]|nr:bifunctional DNA-formamidopyrimidine glycosylase/DNA-(apurinic or apyrimidinic site) lyase [Chloroflexota bacterium]
MRPEHVAAAMDLPLPTFRHERDATYKATRKRMPDDLRPQIERCKQFLDAMGIPIYAVPGFEADDVIGALAQQAEAEGLETMIVSGDLDTLQLVTPKTRLMTTRQGFQNTVIYDEAAIAERFGLRPDQMIEYKALKGDTTDNIPGVPGVGEKTAAKAIADHGTIEGVYANLALFTDRIRKALEEHRDQVFASRELARIVRDVPVRLEPERTRFGPYDRPAVLELFQELEFRSLVPRLPPADGNVASAPVAPASSRTGQLSLGLDAAPAGAPPVPTNVLDQAGIADAMRALRRAESVAVFADAESGRHPALVGLGLVGGDACWYLPVSGSVPAEVGALLRDEKVRIAAHDVKTARRALRRAGSDLAGVEMDTMLASYLINSSRRQHLLDDVALERLGISIPALPGPDRKDPSRVPTVAERAARSGASATATARLADLFREDIARLGLERLYRDIELPLVDVLVEMEEAGIAVDQGYLAKLAVEFRDEIARIERDAYASVGHDFGINSPKQLQDLLFTELKLPRGRRTGTGFSTDAGVLEELRGAHPVVEKILEHRVVEKLRSTYADGLGPLIDRDGRIHTTFEQAHRSRRPDPHDIRAGRRVDRTPLLARPESAEHPHPNAPGASHPTRVRRRRARPHPRCRRLLADRAAHPRAHHAGSRARRGVPPGRRRAPPHGGRGVRRLRGRGHTRAARRGEDAELRDRLWHDRLRSCGPHGDGARRGCRVHRRVLQAVSPRAALRHRDEGSVHRAGLCRDAPRQAAVHTGHGPRELRRAERRRAHGHQHAHPGHRGGHHEDRHDPRAREAARQRARRPPRSAGPRRARSRRRAGRRRPDGPPRRRRDVPRLRARRAARRRRPHRAELGRDDADRDPRAGLVPELPEVETIARQLRGFVVGRTISRFRSYWHRLTEPEPAALFAKRLGGRRISGVRRRGKFVVLDLEGGEALIVSLRMTGQLLFHEVKERAHPYRRAHISFADGTALEFADTRKFGRMAIVETAALEGMLERRRRAGEPLHGHLGVEPLSRRFTVGWLRDALRRRERSAIKPLLLDQTLIAGIGNIYAIEALWRARIHPLRTAGSLRAAEVTRLHEAIRWVLRTGIRFGGASRRDYRDARGEEGRMQQEFQVYGRAGEVCPRCGSEVVRMVVGGRGTFHCPRCQRAPRG